MVSLYKSCSGINIAEPGLTPVTLSVIGPRALSGSRYGENMAAPNGSNPHSKITGRIAQFINIRHQTSLNLQLVVASQISNTKISKLL